MRLTLLKSGKWVVLAAVFSTQVLSETSGEPLSQLALLNRCYGHLTQARLPLNHPARTAVLNGASAVDQCMALLESAALTASGTNEGRLQTDNADTRAILKSLNDFHRTWFPHDDIRANQYGEFGDTVSIHDMGEPGLHVTRTVLGNVPFSQIVTGTSAMEALRSGGAVSNLSRTPVSNQLLTANLSVTPATNLPWNTELVQKGTLLGVRPISSNPIKSQAVIASSRQPVLHGSFLAHKSAGGGILGTKQYLLLNMERPFEDMANGGVKMPRGWSKNVLSDFLCRTIPVVRVSDAVPYVQTSPTSATPSFRSSATCMSCHSTMDPMAALIRNMAYVQMPAILTDPVNDGGKNSSHVLQVAVTLPREVGQVDSDSNFYKRPPNGRFFFRDIYGDLHNEPLLGPAELGAYLSGLDDLYVCAASRYFQYFTGVSVALRDPGDPAGTQPTSAEKAYYEIVLKLGVDFKKHQDPKILIRHILENPIYGSSSLRLNQ